MQHIQVHHAWQSNLHSTYSACTLQPLPWQIKQVTSIISALGSVNGKNEGRKRILFPCQTFLWRSDKAFVWIGKTHIAVNINSSTWWKKQCTRMRWLHCDTRPGMMERTGGFCFVQQTYPHIAGVVRSNTSGLHLTKNVSCILAGGWFSGEIQRSEVVPVIFNLGAILLTLNPNRSKFQRWVGFSERGAGFDLFGITGRVNQQAWSRFRLCFWNFRERCSASFSVRLKLCREIFSFQRYGFKNPSNNFLISPFLPIVGDRVLPFSIEGYCLNGS